jgi:MYXO-CTERM domain-containing protein
MKTMRHSCSTAAILAGGVLFTGPASGAVIFTEGFEGVNAFGMGTYAYASNYTQPNTLTPPGGLFYGKAGAGTPGQVSTNNFPLAPISLTAGSGVSAAQIDSGSAAYDFRGQFSSYLSQGDWAQVSITFKDGANAAIGSPVILGGEVFTQALPTAPFGNYADAKAWGESAFQGVVPSGARTIDVVLSGTKVAGGTAIDGYVDNVSLSVSPVPEPATFTLAGLAGLLLLRRRRR